MAAVPVIINGVIYPKAKGGSLQPTPVVLMGALSIEGLTVGGGPIIPPDAPVPPDPPIDVPPPENPPPNLAVVIKAAPVTGGWGLASQGGQFAWFYMPAQSGAGPKK